MENRQAPDNSAPRRPSPVTSHLSPHSPPRRPSPVTYSPAQLSRRPGGPHLSPISPPRRGLTEEMQDHWDNFVAAVKRRHAELGRYRIVTVLPPDELSVLAVDEELRRLRAIVDQGIKTADGVPLVPDMVVWHAYWAGPIREVVESIGGVTVKGPSMWANNEADEDQLYSTSPAAQAAIDARAAKEKK